MTKKTERMREPDAGPVTAEEALEIAHRFVCGHFRNGKEGPRISIPADPMRDDDIRLVAFIEQSAAEIERLKRDLEGVKEREREHVTRAQDVADKMRRERDWFRREIELLRDRMMRNASERPYSDAADAFLDAAADLDNILTSELDAVDARAATDRVTTAILTGAKS